MLCCDSQRVLQPLLRERMDFADWCVWRLRPVCSSVTRSVLAVMRNQITSLVPAEYWRTKVGKEAMDALVAQLQDRSDKLQQSAAAEIRQARKQLELDPSVRLMRRAQGDPSKLPPGFSYRLTAGKAAVAWAHFERAAGPARERQRALRTASLPEMAAWWEARTGQSVQCLERWERLPGEAATAWGSLGTEEQVFYLCAGQLEVELRLGESRSYRNV